jgi:transglutaminase-like putative cysteine protease
MSEFLNLKQSKIKILAQSLAVLCFLILAKSNVSASIVDKTHVREFVVQADYLKVTETKTTKITQDGFIIPSGSKEGFTIFNPSEGDPEADAKLKKTLDSIKVTENGKEVEFSLKETENKNQVVEVEIERNITPQNPLSLTITYNSYGLLINTGAVKDVYIPGFPEDYTFESQNSSEKVETKVKISNEFPEVNFVSPKQEIKSVEGIREITIPQNDLLGNSTWIQIGMQQYFEFEIKQAIPKTSNIPFALNTFSLPVPRNIQSGPITQQVFFTDLKPNPYSAIEDSEGNLIFNYKTSSSRQMDIYIKGYAILTQDNDFDIENAGNLDNLGSEFDKYLKSAKYWETESLDIQEIADEIKANSKSLDESVQNTYNFVINRIDYSFVKKYGINERKGALATLNGGAAVCMEYSDLFITLLRAQGIPARAAFGYGFGASDFAARLDNDINHQWAEVYIPSKNTWVNVDTTWGEFGNQLIGGDLNHFYSHVAAVDPETPSTSELAFFGKLGDIPERDMNINILKNLDGIDSDNAMSQHDVLEKFTEPNKFGKFKHLAQSQVDIAKDISKDTLAGWGIKSSLLQDIIFYTVSLLPLILILFFVFRKLKKLAVKKTSAPTHELQIV